MYTNSSELGISGALGHFAFCFPGLNLFWQLCTTQSFSNKRKPWGCAVQDSQTDLQEQVHAIKKWHNTSIFNRHGLLCSPVRKVPHSPLFLVPSAPVLIPSAPEGQVVLLWLISCSSWTSVNEFFYLLSLYPFFCVFSLMYLKQAGSPGDQC